MGRTMTTRRLVPLVLLMAVVLALGVAGNARATSENRPPILTAETNLDEDGNIRVHEQGVVSVDVVSEDLVIGVDDSDPLDVAVTNVPEVALDSSAEARLQSIEDAIVDLGSVVGGSQQQSLSRHKRIEVSNPVGLSTTKEWAFPMMDVSTIVVSADTDKAEVVFFTDASTNVPIMVIGSRYRELPAVHSMSLPVPLRTSRLWVACGNSAAFDCEVEVTLVGVLVTE